MIVNTNLKYAKQDEYYTPAYAVRPLLPFLKPNSKILCPFDKESSEYVKVLRDEGKHRVIYTHIEEGKDFFKMKRPNVDYIISNPPYSTKTEVLQRLFEFKIPFAMLLNANGLFETKKRQNLYKNNHFELLYFDKRIDFMNKDFKIMKGIPFPSVYVCSGILPRQIMFAEIKR